jgi:hypothetical protein
MAFARTADTGDLIPANAKRGFGRIFSIVASTIATAFEVYVEASDECAAARERFPLAD